MVMTMFIVVLFMLLFINPQFRKYIKDPENWAKAMSTPLNRSQIIR